MTFDEVREMLLRKAKPYRRNRGSTGIRGWCEKHDVAAAHVSEFMNGKRGPMRDLMEALELEWQVMRKPKTRRNGRRSQQN